MSGGRVVRAVLAALLAVALFGVGAFAFLRGAQSAAPASSQPVATTASTSRPSPTPLPAPSGQEALARFYGQQLRWTACGDDQCTRLTVPLDYAKPGGRTISLAVLKVPATGERRGSLVVNPGGPGGSGIGYARSATRVASAAVRSVYDIVGFDPRGVGESDPVRCLTDSQMDAFLGSDPTPDDPAEQQGFLATSRTFALRCGQNGGPLMAHVSTVEAAKDMDVLRAALGSPRLDYLGKSYGTFLGATYADLFPKLVGHFVLDGAIAPDLSDTEMSLGQAVGFEQATRAYMADCVKRGGCPLGDSVDAGMARLRQFLRSVDVAPLPVANQGVPSVTEGWASLGVAVAMYDQTSWPILTQALSQALAGKAVLLMRLADAYADRSPSGHYDGNLLQANYAVNCLDRSDSKSLSTYQQRAAELGRKAPTWGPYLAWSSMPCGFWPYPATGAAKRITAAGSGPIMVVGTTRDPATPYQWAVRLAAQLENGHLISFEGDGHTAYMRSNACVNSAVDAYYLQGTVPSTGLRC